MLKRIASTVIASWALGMCAYAAEPIKIGVMNMMTGPFAEGGSVQVNGLQLAAATACTATTS
jgi:ABC-type branched-subunit amino acid transport system substrate-binding protein